MYAVFQSCGKQYKVIPGQNITMEKISYKPDNIIEFSKVLMIFDNKKIYLGRPFIKNVKIIAQIISHFRNKKIIILKFKRRKHFRKKQGHRQWFTNLKIKNIQISK
ncbi:MAG: 50S ribosomal protein L21 [Candidatus Makana argininalis]